MSSAASIRTDLPEAVATAAIEFVTGALAENPHRAGEQLRAELAGVHSARRGMYRVLYRINEPPLRDVVVLRIDHRRDAYRVG